jgi:hypothetical protein
MRKTRNYKRKNKKSTRKNIKNKNQKGGMFSNENDHILVGYILTSNVQISTPIIVDKNYTLDMTLAGPYSSYNSFNMSYNLDILLRPMHIRYANNNTPSGNESINLPYKIVNNIFKISLSKLNSSPNLKNINIYRLIDRGENMKYHTNNVELYDENNNLIKFMFGQDNTIKMLADYVDLKYYNIKVFQDRNYNRSYPESLTEFKSMVLAQIQKTDQYITTVRIGDFPEIPLKDGIEALERAYPSLIARVLLDTDAKLVGEEPREVRQSRASRIMEEGMTRIKDERKEEFDKIRLKKESERLEKENLNKRYRTVKLGATLYAILKDADMSRDIDLYEITNYVGPKDFKIINNIPVGKLIMPSRKVKLNETLENERLESERLENEKLEKKRLENEKIERLLESSRREKLERFGRERERLRRERLESERLEKNKRLERPRKEYFIKDAYNSEDELSSDEEIPRIQLIRK